MELEYIMEPGQVYKIKELLYKDEVYKIISCCFEVHKNMGKGFLEVVYKDALMLEFTNNEIPFERERKFEINYKGITLPHYYYSDFIMFGDIILEVKAQSGILTEHYKQIINYLAVSKCKLGLLVNFGEDSLQFKRIVL